MDPISALISFGPGIIRAVGSMFGGKTKQVADGIADVADQAKGLSHDAAAEQMRTHIENLPPQAQAELGKIQVQLAKIKQEQREAELQAQTEARKAESADYSQAQQTIRTQVQSDDEYVRRTRPKIARISAYMGFGYLLVMEIANRLAQAFGGKDLQITGANWELATVFLGPALHYGTMRTLDSFSKKGRTAAKVGNE